ncbi:MAG: choice-of-anchor tandem repeat GloVer-containing protein [Bacteroidota bacterium]
MKKSLLILMVIALNGLNNIYSQTYQLYGTTRYGGINNSGILFKINEDGSNFTILHSFDSLTTGKKPSGNLAQGSDGKLYGICEGGDFWGEWGNIFSFDPITNICLNLYNFDSLNGRTPVTGLTFASNKFYGITQTGGLTDDGVLYCFNPSTNSYNVINNFGPMHNPVQPVGPPLLINNKLYGTTQWGGVNNSGAIYKFDISSNLYSDIYDFDIVHGMSGTGPLVLHSNGLLYGMTKEGGAFTTYGTIFSLDTNTNVVSDLHDFNQNINGFFPSDVGGLIEGNNGILYGMTSFGGDTSLNINNHWGVGVLFSFNPSNNNYLVLHNFDSVGGFSGAPYYMTKGINGKLFGMTSWGGSQNSGVIFSYDINNNLYSVIHNFDSLNGYMPFGVLLERGTPEGIPCINIANSISIYPNPTTTTFTIHQDNFSPNQQIIITDVLGNKVYSQALNTATETIDISHLSGGIYFYEVSGKRGKIIKE